MSSSSTDPRASANGVQADALIDVEMPQLGVSVSEGTLVAWHKKVGDEIAYEEPICDVATDKIDVECPSPASGVIAELLVEPDQTVPVGTVLARIAVGGAAAMPEPVPGTPEAAASQPTVEVPPLVPAPPRQAGEDPPEAPFVSPVVRRAAAEHDIDPETVKGSGRLGRVTKRDIRRALREREAASATAEAPMHIESPYREEPPVAAAQGDPATDVHTSPPPESIPTPTSEPLSRVRRLIGEHMRRSLDTAAHCTTIFEADMSAVELRRSEIGATYVPVVARCVVEALRAHPALNAWLQDDRLTRHEAVHLGIAVDLGDHGLVVPVIRDAQVLSDEGLAGAIRDLAGRARAGELRPGETDGGTFTITNPGALGAIAATPVINLPQVAILDLEAVVKRPVVVAGPGGEDAIGIRPMMNLCLSWDHRALDGAAAARFLATLRDRLERA